MAMTPLPPTSKYKVRLTHSLYLLLIFILVPVELIGPSNITVRLGNTASLHCNTNGYPIPNISWWRYTEQLLADNDRYTITYNLSITTGSYNSILSISNVTYTDDGSYYCVAENSLAEHSRETSFEASVTIYGKLRVRLCDDVHE